MDSDRNDPSRRQVFGAVGVEVGAGLAAAALTTRAAAQTAVSARGPA